MTTVNPFTERGRIDNPERFVGRWRELAMAFERLAERRPVLLAGPPGIGKSSLLMHMAQSADVNLERPDLQSLFVDLALLADAPAVYRLVLRALGGSGDSLAALELELLQAGKPILLALDNAQLALAAGWGEWMLEGLARLARRMPAPGEGHLLLAVSHDGPAPLLSEPFAVLTLGAVAPTEVRLLAEAYLGEDDPRFSAQELRELATISAGYPSYLQRAAYHLFEARLRPGYDWRAAFLAEARERPVPGAPLPPEAFVGEESGAADELLLGGTPGSKLSTAAPPADLRPLLALLAALLLAGLVYWLLGPWFAIPAALIGLIAVALWQRRRDRLD